MRPVTDDPVAWRVSLSVTRLSCAKTTERIEVRFRMQTLRDPIHIASGEGPDLLTEEGVEDNTAHCQQLGLLWPLVRCGLIIGILVVKSRYLVRPVAPLPCSVC